MANNRKLGRTTDIRLQMVYSQASELLWHGKIETTVDRAKEVRKVAEKMLTLAINIYKHTYNRLHILSKSFLCGMPQKLINLDREARGLPCI